MKLILEKSIIINDNFIKYIIKILSRLFIITCNTKKLKVIEDYINDNDMLQLNKKILLRSVVLQASRNVIYYKYGNYYYIQINPRKKLIGTNVKLIDVCKFINYGNFEIRGYPLFINCFINIKNNIKYYIRNYKLENKLF